MYSHSTHVAVVLLAPVLLSAAEFETVDLFTAGEAGYKLYRIPGLVVTAKGTVLAYCEARKSDASDWGTIDILLRRSTDGGRTWEPARRIADVPGPKPKNPVALAHRLARPDDVTYHNPVAIADRSGVVHLLFGLEYARMFYCRSDDDGQSFTAPTEITGVLEGYRPGYAWKVIAAGPAHGVQLRGGARPGRLVVPIWMSTGTGGHGHRPSAVASLFSDDGGATWNRGDIVADNNAELVNPNETCVAELSDGRVLFNIRSESPAHRRALSVSPDGATGWSQPRYHEGLREPICMASMVSLPGSEGRPSRLVFANPDNLDGATGKPAKPGQGRVRKNLTLKVSADDGQTWPISRVLEPGFAGYSDLAALPDGTVLCLYECGSTDGKSSYRTGMLRLARLPTAWLATSP